MRKTIWPWLTEESSATTCTWYAHLMKAYRVLAERYPEDNRCIHPVRHQIATVLVNGLNCIDICSCGKHIENVRDMGELHIHVDIEAGDSSSHLVTKYWNTINTCHLVSIMKDSGWTLQTILSLRKDADTMFGNRLLKAFMFLLHFWFANQEETDNDNECASHLVECAMISTRDVLIRRQAIFTSLFEYTKMAPSDIATALTPLTKRFDELDCALTKTKWGKVCNNCLDTYLFPFDRWQICCRCNQRVCDACCATCAYCAENACFRCRLVGGDNLTFREMFNRPSFQQMTTFGLCYECIAWQEWVTNSDFYHLQNEF